MAEDRCDTSMLETLRRQALLGAAGASDPLLRQQFVDLADAYAATAISLREHGGGILPSPLATDMPWRSVPLWVSNDR